MLTEALSTGKLSTCETSECADDVLTREKLVSYHDSYAKAMQKYGLLRGIRDSEARHTTTAQYYRELKKRSEVLETESKLYSREFNQHFKADGVVCSLKQNTEGKFDFWIDGVSHVSWFRRKKDEFMKTLRLPTRNQDKGIRL